PVAGAHPPPRGPPGPRPGHAMINTFAQIDFPASAGRSPWHRASALAKLLLTGLYVTLAVITPSWGVLLVLLATVLGLCASAQVPRRLTLAAATQPLLFAAIF